MRVVVRGRTFNYCLLSIIPVEQNRAALQSKRESDAAHRMELKEIQETFMEKMRSGETDRARLDEVGMGCKQVIGHMSITTSQLHKMSETLRARAIEWDNRMKAMEKQIRLEENAKRQELMAKLQVLAQHRESLQQSLNAHLQTHRQTITDYESKMTRERDGQQEHYAKLAHLTHERDALRAEMQRLKERADRFDAVEAECTRLKSELNRAQQALDRVREDEMSRAKDLERAVSGYVRSVERAERKVAQE